MPKRIKGEKKNDYVGRCMGNEKMKSKFSDTKQRAAVCYSYWDEGLKESTLTFKQYLNEYKDMVDPLKFSNERLVKILDKKDDEFHIMRDGGDIYIVHNETDRTFPIDSKRIENLAFARRD